MMRTRSPRKVDDIPIAPSLYSLSNKMGNSLLAVRDNNHIYIVVEKRIKKCQRKDVEESVDKIIANRMSKAYSEWKSNQDTQSFNENIEKEYQKLLETLSPEQEKVLTKYCDEIFASGAETEEFFYRLGIKDGLRLKSTVKSVLEMMS